LRTRDRRIAVSRARQLDALLERTAAMDASGTITAAQFAGLARDHMHSLLEAARARRAPDPVLATGGDVEASLDPTLANRILDFILAAEDAPPDDDHTASHLSPAGRDGGPIYLPDDLAAPLIAAVGSAPPPERPMRRSTLAGALHRSQAALGRAMVVRRALMVNDAALAREMVVSAAAAAGVKITPEVRPLLERVGLRVLEGVFREEAVREAGIYKSVPEEDPCLAALHLHPSTPQKARTPSVEPGEMAIRAQPAVAPEPCQATAVSAEPSAAAPPSTAPAVPLSSLVEPFFAKRTRDKIRQQGMAQERTTLRLFFEIVGDRPAREYGRHDITAFLDTLRRLPSRYGKSPKDKDLSIQELIERADETDAQRLADKTVKRHLSALSVFFKLAVDRGHLTLTERNDIIGEHDFSLDDAREARDQWTGEELHQLFSSAVWTGRDPSRRSAPGMEIARDARFWIPLLCVFEGTRLEEVADLRRKDVRNEAGVWQMEITTEHRRLKNNSAKRAVPIHPELIRLGFLEYVARIAPQPTNPLFPDLEPQGADQKRGPRITRWFVEYRRDIGVFREGVGAHAFRHNVNTRLREELHDYSDQLRLSYLLGHASGTGEGDVRYDKGREAHAVAALVARLKYPEVNLAHLHIREDRDFSVPSDW
jgi:integrase